MVLTRRSAALTTNSFSHDALQGDARLQRELHIDGTKALRGGKVERSAGRTCKYGGARYAVEEDDISGAQTGHTIGGADNRPPPVTATRRTPTEAAAAPPTLPAPKTRKRALVTDEQTSSSISKKRRRAIPSAPAKRSKKRSRIEDDGEDAEFLRETARQLKRVKVPKKSSRHEEIRITLKYIDSMEAVTGPQIYRQIPDSDQRRLMRELSAWELNTREAKRLLRSHLGFTAPLFVTGVSQDIVDGESGRRPIEEVLDWFADPEEGHWVDALDLPPKDGNPPQTKPTMAEIRQRFLGQEHQLYPWNFPELPLPMPAAAIPSFLQSPQCNFLEDIVRYLQDVDSDDVCRGSCGRDNSTADGCKDHLFTANEVVELQHSARLWRGTVMLGEAGALTQSHFDSLGFGTVIVCYEGSIGFAWTELPEWELSHPHESKKDDATRKWWFRVLKPGEAVYTGPGTKHMVLRQPEGQQTLATSARVIRYRDFRPWVKTMSRELQSAIDDKKGEKENYKVVVRALVLGAQHFLDQAQTDDDDLERFGGRSAVESAQRYLEKIEKQYRAL